MAVQDATFTVSDDGQTIDVETENRLNGGVLQPHPQYTRVSYLPPPKKLPPDAVDDDVQQHRGDIDDLIHNEYPHMQGRLILEEFRDYGGRRYYLRVYEDSRTVTINGVQYVVVTRLICGFDNLNNRIVILIPWVDPEQPPEDVEPPPRPPLNLPRLNLPHNCMVVTNLKRLREVHGDDYDEVLEFAESFGPVIDLGAHLEDDSDWQAADAVIEEQFNREQYGCLFIFGDGEIVPFGVYENPLFGERIDEQDRIILSDDPYGDFDHDPHDSWDLMVARLLNDPDVLEAVAHRLAEPHEEETPPRSDFAVYGNANWPLTEVLASLGSPDDPQLRWSEPHNEDDFSDSFFDGRHVIINLHGSDRDGSHYWGEVKRDDATGDIETVIAMNVAQANAPGAIVLAGCCYGAHIDGKRADNCIALKYLAGGAEAYIGSTMINYIGQTADTSYGLWGRLFVTDVREGVSPQEAFLQAKREYALSLDENPLQQFKTYHQMVYLGLPPMEDSTVK